MGWCYYRGIRWKSKKNDIFQTSVVTYDSPPSAVSSSGKGYDSDSVDAVGSRYNEGNINVPRPTIDSIYEALQAKLDYKDRIQNSFQESFFRLVILDRPVVDYTAWFFYVWKEKQFLLPAGYYNYGAVKPTDFRSLGVKRCTVIMTTPAGGSYGADHWDALVQWTAEQSERENQIYMVYPRPNEAICDVETWLNNYTIATQYWVYSTFVQWYYTDVMQPNTSIRYEPDVTVIEKDVEKEQRVSEHNGAQDSTSQATKDEMSAEDHQLGDEDFPRTEGMYAQFFDGHTFYFPNGTVVNPTRTRSLNNWLRSIGVLEKTDADAYLYITHVLDPVGTFWRGVLSTHNFVAYGRKDDYPKPPRIPFNNEVKGIDSTQGKTWSGSVKSYYRGVGADSLNEIILTQEHARRVGLDMERIKSLNVLGSFVRNITIGLS